MTISTYPDNDTNFGLEVALGNVSGYAKVNKFGKALDCDSGIPTDVWDGADGTTSTDVWVAPTQARTHLIASTSGNDAGAGSGMQTMQVYGLADWDSAETSEVVSVGDTTAAYVIIHRIKGLTFGATGSNEGIITATATTDATITAAIQIGDGQTLMVIYGVPSTQTLHMTKVTSGILRSVTTVTADLTLLVKENADLATAGFIGKEEYIMASGSPVTQYYSPPKSFTGPCIVKLQVTTGSNNSQVTGAFDAYIVDN